MKRLSRRDPPLVIFQLTIAGWGYFQLYGKKPQRVDPGVGFFAVIPSRQRCYLPESSPGWTYGRINICHPFLVARVSKLIASIGPLIECAPDSALTACALRLIRGAIKKDFRDEFEVELALFEFIIACERWALQRRRNSDEGRRLLDAVRTSVVAALPRALPVKALATECGMSRSNFSHYFHGRTGLTPAHFSTEVRIHEAARTLLTSSAPVKQIAKAFGFRNPSHFCRLFRRYQYLSPDSYRRIIR